MTAPSTAQTRRRSRTIAQAPSGFRYVPDFIDTAEEDALLAHIERLIFAPFHMRGVDAKREVAHFGARYGFDEGALAAAPPMPPFLAALAARVNGTFSLVEKAEKIAALVTRYPPGAGIGWHRDAPPFGPAVIGLSLLSPCEFRLRLETETGYDVYRQEVAPRSLYIVSGHTRFRWQHAIPPVASLRYSLTFRTVR